MDGVEAICKYCEHFDGDYCLRYPPVPLLIGTEVIMIRPRVDDTDTCGEWLVNEDA